MITFLHGAKFIRILRRRCTVCKLKKRSIGHNFDLSKDTPVQLHLVCRRCEYLARLTQIGGIDGN